jgi:hypothetical protein
MTARTVPICGVLAMLSVCFTLAVVNASGAQPFQAGDLIDDSKPKELPAKSAHGLPPGTYGGCDQTMVIGQDGVVSYRDRLHLTRIRIEPDGSLYATFPTEAGLNEEIHLQPSNPEHTRPVWTSGAEGRTYKATAMPHSPETYSFRLEVRRDGRLVAGSQVFCAICKSKVDD